MRTNTICLAIATVLAAATVARAGTITIDSHTVALWNFDEQAGAVIDATGHGWNGVALHGVQTGVTIDGRTGYRFDGTDDYVSLSTALLAAGLPQGTVEAWVRLEEYAPYYMGGGGLAPGARHLFHRGVPYSTTALGLSLYGPTGTVSAALSDTVVPPSAAGVALDRWTHVMLTWDGSLVREYLDDILVNEFQTSATPDATASSVVEIGRYSDPFGGYFGGYFKGVIDAMAISDVPRTPEAPLPSAAASGLLLLCGLGGAAWRSRRRTRMG